MTGGIAGRIVTGARDLSRVIAGSGAAAGSSSAAGAPREASLKGRESSLLGPLL